MKNTVIITGATSGIGYAICETLIDAGYPIIGIGRSESSCNEARQKLAECRPYVQTHFIAADLMQQSEVIRAAKAIKECLAGTDRRIHALINNAGCVRSRYMTTAEGYEQQFALNHLAGFLLTEQLMPLIKRDNATVINTSSTSHKMMRMNWNDLMFQKGYRPLRAYKQSKLCNMLFAHRLRELGVRACGVHPGLVNTDIGGKNTSGIVNFIWNLRKKQGISPEQSAQIYLSLCENGFTGLYYGLRKGTNGRLEIENGNFGNEAKQLRQNRQVNHENAKRLYDISLKLCGMQTESENKMINKVMPNNETGERENECTDNRRKWWSWQSNGNGLRKARI
ncbi:MAG: SDR family NAD(P)-dependent oxidoreductase [Oscillospiraceae bacterium]|nr:SDR family NAD(P)-dependent oxidoreductase [Oscillospiraceae bacterium]